MATTITNTMLNGLRQHIVDMASYGRYKIGGTWYRAEIETKAVQQNGAVHVTFFIRDQAGGTPASQFQLLNADNQLLAERAENVAFAEYMDAILYRFKFGVSVSENQS